MVKIPMALRRFPSSLILTFALATFVGSVLIFVLPFEVEDVGPSGTTAGCGPPIFEIAASEYATPSTVMPQGTTLPLSPLAQLTSTTPSTTAAPFGAPITSAVPRSTALAPGSSLPADSSSSSTTIDPVLVKEACGGPASQRFLLGGLGMIAALLIGYLARLRRSSRFGYVVR